MTAPTDSTRAAVVDRAYHWRPITPDTPRGCKLQLINRAARVATYGVLATDPGFWTHWAPLPTFGPDVMQEIRVQRHLSFVKGFFLALFAAVAIVMGGMSNANLDSTRAAACGKWAASGFECVGYIGWTFGPWLGGTMGGAKVWHTLRRDGVLYTGYAMRWGDEFHTYELKAIQ